MKLSTVTLTYNNFDELQSTLSSIPEDGRIEKIVINAGSCLKTKTFLDSAQDIKSLSEPDKGISDGFNKGILKSTGDLLLFLNSGDRLMGGDYLDWAFETFSQNPEVMFTHGSIIFLDPVYGNRMLRPLASRIGRGMPFFHQTMIFKKVLFEQLGLFDLGFSIAMDYEFVCRTVNKGLQSRYYSKGPVVEMDGAGISQSKELKSIRESFSALGKNKLLRDPRVVFDFWERAFRFLGRKSLEKAGLSRWVSSYKKVEGPEPKTQKPL